MNTYRLHLFGLDGGIAQVSEVQCPGDDLALAFAAERGRDHATAELWAGERLVARLGPARPDGRDSEAVDPGPAAQPQPD